METVKNIRSIRDFRVTGINNQDPDRDPEDVEEEFNLIWHLCKFCKTPFKTKKELNVHKKAEHFQQLRELQRKKQRVQEEEEEELRQRLGTYYDIENELESELSSTTITATMNNQQEEEQEEENQMEIEMHNGIVMNSIPTPIIVSNDALDNRGFEFSTMAESPQSNIEQAQAEDEEEDQDLKFEVIDLTEDEEENSSSSLSSSVFSSSSLQFPSECSSTSSTGLLKALLSNNKDLVVVEKDCPKIRVSTSAPETISLLLQMRDNAFENQIKRYLNMKSDDSANTYNNNNNNNNKKNYNNKLKPIPNLLLWNEKASGQPAQIINNNNNYHNLRNKEPKSIPNPQSSILRHVLTKDNNNKSTVKRQRAKTRTRARTVNKKYDNNHLGKLEIKCKLCGGYFTGVRGLKRHLEGSHKDSTIKNGVVINEILKLNLRRKISQSPLNKIEGLVDHVGKEQGSKSQGQSQRQLPPPPPLLLCGVHPTSPDIIKKIPALKMIGDSIQSPHENNNTNNNNNSQTCNESRSNSNCNSCPERAISPFSYDLTSMPNFRGHNSNPSNLNTGKLCCVNCSQNFTNVNAFAHHIIRCM